MKALSLHSEPHIMFYLYSFRVNIEQQNLARSTPTKCPLPSPGVHNDRINFYTVWLERCWLLHGDLGATSSGAYITCRIREGDFSAYSHMRTSRFMCLFLTTATELHLKLSLSDFYWLSYMCDATPKFFSVKADNKIPNQLFHAAGQWFSDSATRIDFNQHNNN